MTSRGFSTAHSGSSSDSFDSSTLYTESARELPHHSGLSSAFKNPSVHARDARHLLVHLWLPSSVERLAPYRR